MNNLCFDIGGTFIKYALFEDDRLIEKAKVKTPQTNQKKTIIATLIDIYIKNDYNNHIAISSAGIIRDNKVVYTSSTMKSYVGTDFNKQLRDELNVAIVVINDVDAATYAEFSKCSVQSLLCIVIGTGIGGGYIDNNQLLQGASSSALNIGAMKITNDSREIETKVSTKAILDEYYKKTNKEIDGETFFMLLQNNDQIVLEIYSSFVNLLGLLISNLVCVLDPELIVIGGGISSTNYDLINDINKSVKKYLTEYNKEFLKIKKAYYENDAALYGVNKLLLKNHQIT